MKKFNVFFIFMFLLNFLCGCDLINPKYNCLSATDISSDSLCIINDGRNYSLIHVETFKIEEDYYIEEDCINNADFFKYRKAIILECEVKKDFGDLLEDGTIVRIPICASLNKKEQFPDIEEIRQWISQLDGLLIKCIAITPSYYDLESIYSSRFLDETNKVFYLKENLMKMIEFSHNKFIGFKNGKIDINTYKEIANYTGQTYFTYFEDYIYDGASSEKLLDHLKLMNSYGFNSCELQEIPFRKRIRKIFPIFIGPICAFILIGAFIFMKLWKKRND